MRGKRKLVGVCQSTSHMRVTTAFTRIALCEDAECFKENYFIELLEIGVGRCGPQRAKVVTSCLLSESLCLAEHVSVCGRNWGWAELFCLVQVSGTEHWWGQKESRRKLGATCKGGQKRNHCDFLGKCVGGFIRGCHGSMRLPRFCVSLLKIHGCLCYSLVPWWERIILSSAWDWHRVKTETTYWD